MSYKPIGTETAFTCPPPQERPHILTEKQIIYFLYNYGQESLSILQLFTTASVQFKDQINLLKSTTATTGVHNCQQV